MSRSNTTHHRHQQKLQLQQQQQQQQLLAAQQQEQMAADTAATELFDYFCLATTMRQILGLHRDMCDLVGLRPGPLNEFYPKLKQRVRSWKAQALWKKFDARAAHRAYAKGTACTGTRVLVIGAGPCGLRTAIEAQLLGAKVVVIEKRDRISRNNVLHLWPFVITDLRNLGAKKFYGKFCAGSIDHISIRQLQCILLKVALLLGVEVHEGVSFDRTIEPSGDGCGWRAAITPADHAVSHYEFDVLIGADGKRNTLEGFKRKEFRGKLAIAITANFINKKTEAEAKAEEISGVAFIFNQSFFKELYHTTGIDLENIVYYKDETHYFVMTAKKHSLIDKGVILQDFADPACLLAPANVSREKLLDYAREAAEFSTKYQMPNLEFAVNHYGRPDVAMFDFTSMFAAETSCRCIVRKGFRLLQCLVGDSLLEPFWPTGSGCARGFLSSMDAAYALKLWSNPRNSSLAVLAQRESIYRLLNQTTPENLQRDIGSYTVDPATRYPNLNRSSVNAWQVKHLVDTDDASVLEQTFMDTNALQPPTQVDSPMRRKRRSGDSQPLSAVLLRWISAQLHAYEFAKELKEVSDVFSNGRVLCALINRYRPDLVDYAAVKDLSPAECNEIAFNILDKELRIPRVMSGKESIQLNSLESKVWLPYLEQVCETFRGEIPHVKHPKMDFSDLREKYRLTTAHVQPDFSKLLQISTKQKMKAALDGAPKDTATAGQDAAASQPEEKHKRHRREMVQNAPGVSASGQGGATDTPRRAKKRRSAEKTANIEERQKRLQEIEQNRQDRMSKRRQQRYKQTQNFYTSLHMLQANTLLRESADDSPFEDYSIFLYRQQAPEFNDRVKDLERKLLFPDRDRGDIPSALPRSAADEQFSDRIKSMEQRISSRNNVGTDKKPKDLMRAIGKIDSSDWNVREIEKKIEQSKKTEIHGPKGREKVPKWSKEQFVARQTKMSKPIRQDSREEEKFREIDQTIRNLDKQLKEGSVLEVGERGRNKVASIAGQFVKKDDTSDEKNQPSSSTVAKSTSKVALNFKKQAASEKCHFCKQTVYLMEKITTENLILHRSCLKCHHCHTNLRPGGYAFDRDDPNGRFYCTQHFRLPAKAIRPVVRKPGQRKPTQQQQAAAAAAAAANATATPDTAVDGGEPKTPEKLRRHADNVAQLDLLDRGQTPERIEFENTDAMSDGEPSEEHIIDEHEWSGRNFLPESNNDSESDLSSSDESDTESDSDMFEEANDSPLGAQTLQLASDWIGKQNYSESDDSDDFYDSSEGIADDDGKDDTEGEEFKKARELRREEVRLLPLPANLPTDTETEIKLNESSDVNNEQVPLAIKSEDVVDNVKVEGESRAPNDKPVEEVECSTLPEKSFKSEQENIQSPLEDSIVPQEALTSEIKPEVIKETKPEVINETKPEVINETKPEVINEAKQEFINEAQPVVSKEAQPTQPITKESQPTASNESSSMTNRQVEPMVSKETPSSIKKEAQPLISNEIQPLVRDSSLTMASEASKSSTSLSTPPSRSDIERLEQHQDRKFSADIEAISEKLYRLNSVVKMNKDLETLAKENLVKSDILKKLTLKEKWLADNNAGNALSGSTTSLAPKSAFDEKIIKLVSTKPEEKPGGVGGLATPKKAAPIDHITKAKEIVEQLSKVREEIAAEKSQKRPPAPDVKKPEPMEVAPQASESPNKVGGDSTKAKSPRPERKPLTSNLSRNNSLKKSANQLSPAASPRMEKSSKTAGSAAASRSNSFKSNASSSPRLSPKRQTQLSRTNSLKKEQAAKEAASSSGKMQIENILNIVKRIDLSKDKEDIENKIDDDKADVGKMLYEAENDFMPKTSKGMSTKLKEIEASSFAGTRDSIKSQMITPTMSQASSTVDLSRYFPNQKQTKVADAPVNKTQKNLKDVDLAKYFPASPVPQRKTAVVTVADKLKKSQTEKAVNEIAAPASKAEAKKAPPKRQASMAEPASGGMLSLKEHQLDGAVDITKKKVAVTNATATATKKGNVKIIKKIVPKGTKAKKAAAENAAGGDKKPAKLDDPDKIFDELLLDNEMSSPSLEYQALFKEEKSPSEDVSDKIERILEETGIDLGSRKKGATAAEKRKKLLKTKSLGEGEFDMKAQELSEKRDSLTKEDGDRPSGVQNLLKRFESMSSVKSDEHAFKLRRMESTTSNLNRSRESIVSRESDSMSDLEKTMEYLKTEWRNEATNFLQKKRDTFFAQKRTADEESAASVAEQNKKSRQDDLPVQYRESKLAKFFGIKAKSPEKKKSPKKQKSPEKKKPQEKKKSPEKRKSPEKTKQALESSDKDIKQVAQSAPTVAKKIETEQKKAGQNVSVGKDDKGDEKKNASSATAQVQQEPITSNGLGEPKSLVEKVMASLDHIKKLEKNLSQETIEEDAFALKISSRRSSLEGPQEQSNVAGSSVSSRRNSGAFLESPGVLPVEDIRNLPKTGCDKSLSSSRRGSQISLLSRRLSDTPLPPKVDTKAPAKEDEENADVDELFANMVEDMQLDSELKTVATPVVVVAEDDCSDSLCTSISKSPSVAPTTVRLRGSSENDEIEQLFSKFSDEMLVNVEFDSNDELVAITPRVALNREAHDATDEDLDHLAELESLERDEEAVQNRAKGVTTSVEPLFPTRPGRRLKSTSSSSEPSAPIPPQRLKKKLAKMSPSTMPPSIQDLVQEAITKNKSEMPPRVASKAPNKFPQTFVDEEIVLPSQPTQREAEAKSVKVNEERREDSHSPKMNRMHSSSLLKAQNVEINAKSANVDPLSTDKTLKNEIEIKFDKNVKEADAVNQELQPAQPAPSKKSPSPSASLSESITARATKESHSDSNSCRKPSMESQLEVSPKSITPSPKAQDSETFAKSPKNSSRKPSTESQLDVSPKSITPPQKAQDSEKSAASPANSSRKPSMESQLEVSPKSITPPQKTQDTEKSAALPANFSRKPSTESQLNVSPESMTPPQKAQSKEKSSSLSSIASRNSLQKPNDLSTGSSKPNAPSQKEKSASSASSISQDPIRKVSKESLLDVGAPQKHSASREKSLEWNMEHLPISPMPRRKNLHIERPVMPPSPLAVQRAPVQRPRSPSPPVATQKPLLVPQISEPSVEGDEERRLIEQFENERRQALIKRDREYEQTKKPATPPPKVDAATKRRSSIKNDEDLERYENALVEKLENERRKALADRDREYEQVKKPATPPPKMDAEAMRRSSIKSDEDLERYENAVIEKLERERRKALADRDREYAEIERKMEENQIKKGPPKIPEYKGLIRISSDASVSDRAWPDGVTKFRPDSDDETESKAGMRQLRSQSPTTPRYGSHFDDNASYRTPSKSTNDLRRLSPPYSATLSGHTPSMQSLAIGGRLSQSSADTEHPMSLTEADRSVARSTARSTPDEPLDASTRMLLDRSKRLHNRKRDFINERVVERNPYMRGVIDKEALERQAMQEAEEQLESYRPRNYTRPSTSTRFPTSRAVGRKSMSPLSNYDYISVIPPTSSYSSYRPSPPTSSSSRHLLSSALPSSSGSHYYHHPIGSSSASSYLASAPRGSGSYYGGDLDYSSPSMRRDPHQRAHSKDSCVQSESESSSQDEVELNSATEISTDSEFDHDEKNRRIREAPRIFIDDTHLRKQPTKVQVKSSVIATSPSHKYPTVGQHHHRTAIGGGSYLQKYQPPAAPPQPQFKPLVQVDPTLLMSTQRAQLQNPRPGDYLLNKTASTEGIASKKSLELKKRYLLGEAANGNKIQKSGSTSVLDSKIRSFQSNISECQKLLNPGGEISPSMKTFLDRTKQPNQTPSSQNELMRSATSNIINELKVEITIQKASSTASTDNEKENVFVNSKNELNKGMEYSETVNTTLLENISKKSPPTPTNQTIIETINLVSPDAKGSGMPQTPTKTPGGELKSSPSEKDSNKIIDLTIDSPPPVKSNANIPDVSKDAAVRIPDIIEDLKADTMKADAEDNQLLLNDGDDEKADSPEKLADGLLDSQDTLQIQVPTIPWITRKAENGSSTTGSTSCSSSNSSSIEDIQHYILDSTTSPDTNTAGGGHQVPRVQVHDSSGTLMPIDSLMIDEKYTGADSDDVLPKPAKPAIRTTVVEDEADVDVEPVTATPEPADCTVIEAESCDEPPPLPEQGPPLPEKGPPKMKPSLLKFDSRNENKIESLKHLPLIVDDTALVQETKAVKPQSLNLHKAKGSPDTPTNTAKLLSPTSPMYDNDKTPTADQLSRCSDSENEATGTGQALTETELSDWTADDCISENFVDMEFANSTHNSGTIRRNKKKHASAKVSSTHETAAAEIKMAPMVGFEGIDIDDIEFMDTGSEGSCAEAYSATNTALLRNRGYVEFIEPTPSPKLMKPMPTAAPRNPTYNSEPAYRPYESKRDEKLGIDYIEQGAYILQRDGPHPVDLLKTPVNETPVAAVCVPGPMTQSAGSVTMTQSLTDSSTLNDLDEDSTTQATNTTVPTTPKLTTDESEGLTVVTSPLDSTSPSARTPTARNEAKSTSGSSSEKNPKTSQSTGGGTSSAPPSSKATPPRQSSQEAGQPMFTEELSYQDCVRALQHKITQISNARDSLDSRKQRRKSSKGETAQIVVVSLSPPEVSTATPQTVIASDLEQLSQTAVPKVAPESQVAAAPASSSPQFHKVPEIPTLTRKLEEITKERTKQKDLIHDLVMDKLQSKKQLNAEKRLHRSRQRALLTSGGGGGGGGYTSGSSLSPTPKPCDPSATTQAACSNLAHYHVSTAAPEKEPRVRSFSATRPPLVAADNASKSGAATYSSFKENNPLQKSHTYVSAYGYSPKRGFSAQTAAAMAYKPRPFSEHIDIEHVEAGVRYHLSKTPSFSYGASRPTTKVAGELAAEQLQTADGPSKPLRKSRNDGASSVSASTESLRCEARARARLKSNSELGLSPEEKMQQLRRRLYEEHLSGKGKGHNTSSVSAHTSPTKQAPSLGLAAAAGLSECERKISASKSVNDLAYGQQQRRLADEKGKAVSADFTTQPSLLMAPNATASQPKDASQKTQKSARRAKDPERRKSLIKSLSSFFHMGSSSSATSSAAAPSSSTSSSSHHNTHHNKDKQGASGSSAAHSAAAERPGPGGSSSTASGSNDGVFSLFRISPKHKSKDKDGNPLLPDGRSVSQGHERTSSQDCINSSAKAHKGLGNNTQHTNKHSSNNTAKKQHQQNTSTTTTTKTAATPKSTGFSSSSPQLYMPKSSVNTTTTKYHTSTAKSSEAHTDELMPPPIPPLPLNYQRSDDESYATETRDQKKQRAISKAVRQAELKRLRIAQEIQREQEEIEVQLKELEARGVLIEKALRGEGPTAETPDNIGHNDERLLKELLEIWRNITQLKKRDEELGIRQQELQLEHRHAQLKEELNLRLSCNKLDKSSADVAAEGAILNEMLEIVARRAALRPTTSNVDLTTTAEQFEHESGVTLQPARGQSLDIDESNI